MLFLKAYYHIIANIKKVLYKIIYRKKIKIGNKVTFRKGFSIMIDKNASVEIGDNCFFNNYCSINAMESIRIGNNCLFGENVKIYDHNHIFKYKNKLIKKQGYKTKAVIIGDNCWIGSGSIILKNAKIGNNVVVGAGNVIDKELQDDVIVNQNKITNIKFVEG